MVTAASALCVYAKEFTEEDGEALAESCEYYLGSLYTYDETELEEMKDLGDFYMVTANMIQSEEEELGDFVQVLDGTTVDITNDAVTVHVPAQYENYTADVVFTFDATGTTPKNFVINPDFSLGEKMMGALQNFLLGIIIVFVILLFLAFIISLLKYVNPDYKKKKAEEKAKKAETAEKTGSYENIPKSPLGTTAEAAAAPAAVPAAAAAAAADDSELIAVIAAAIAAAEAESGGSYIVRSIRRAGTRNWTRS